MISAFNSLQKSWVWKLIPIAIAVPLLITTITGTMTGTHKANYLVNFKGNEGINYQEFQRAYQNQYNAILNQIGAEKFAEIFTPELEKQLKESTLNSIIDNRLLLLYANKVGVVVTDEEIAKEIKLNPYFQENGKYNEDYFKRFLAANNISVQTYFSYIRTDLVRERMEAYLRSSAIVVPKEVKVLTELAAPSMEVQVASLDASKFTANINPSEEELQAYYNTHKDEFEIPAEAVFSYIVYSPEELLAKAPKVTEAEIRKYYDDNINLYRTDTYDLADIVVSSAKTANAVIDELKAGKSFAEVAALYSEDLGSKDNGGKLGVLSSQDLPKKLASVVDLMKEGTYSQPIKDDGFYHILFLAKKEFHETSFEEAKAGIETKFEQDTKANYVKDLRAKLQEVADRGEKISESSKILGLDVKTTETFTETTIPAPLDKQVASLAFNGSLETGKATGPQALGDKEIIVQVDKFREKAYKNFADVREEVLAKKKLEIALNQEKDRLTLLADNLNANSNLSEQEIQAKLSKEHLELSAIQNVSYFSVESQAYLQPIFTNKFAGHKTEYTVLTNEENHTVYFVAVHGFKVEEPRKELLESFDASYVRAIADSYTNSFLTNLRKEFEVEINWNLLGESEE